MISRVGDVGTEILLEFTTLDCDEKEIPLDISGQTTLEIILKPPTGVLQVHPAVFTAAPCGLGTGVDGKASYFTIAADLNEAGEWKFQGHVILPTGEWHTSEASFKVRAILV